MNIISQLGTELVGKWLISFALYECPACGNHFKANISDIKRGRKKNCGCKVERGDLPDTIGGYKVIRDLGTRETGRRRAIVQCPLCNTSTYQVDVAQLRLDKIKKHCGCKQRVTRTLRTQSIKSSIWDNPILAAMSDADKRTLKFAHGSMVARCTRTTHPKYRLYGARGIDVCKRWRASLYYFMIDMGKRPSADLSIDRIDNNGNYETGNVRWATSKQQQNNKRNNVMR